jgi:predicted RNA-binding protein YlqC (UPF0109 family)
MIEVVEVLVEALVDHPDEVEVTDDGERRGTVYFKVRVAPGDIGKVIGRGGKIANSIRVVVNHAAAAEGLRAMVDFNS